MLAHLGRPVRNCLRPPNFHQSDTILVGILTIGALWLVTDRLALQPLERWTVERWGLVTTEGV